MVVSSGVLLALAAGAADAQKTHLRVGDPAPDFSATSHTGATVTLRDYSGQKLMLWFYPRAGTGG